MVLAEPDRVTMLSFWKQVGTSVLVAHRRVLGSTELVGSRAGARRRKEPRPIRHGTKH